MNKININPEQSIFTEYYIEKNIWELFSSHIKNYKNILVVHGHKSLASVKNNLEKSLGNLKSDFIYYGGECSHVNADKIIDESKNKNYDLILAVGGGKVIDTAKIVGLKLELPIFVIPTIASTCACTSKVCAVYKNNHSFDEVLFLKRPPQKVFIDLTTIFEAPKKYFWAGMGDTLAKYYEMRLKTKNQELDYSTNLGWAICSMCKNSIIYKGKVAYETSTEITPEFKEVAGTILISTGYTSSLIEFFYNSAVAHIVCYAFCMVPEVEEKHLHGEMVSFGILIQLLLENNISEYNELVKFYETINLPTKLSQIISKELFLKYREPMYNQIMKAAEVEKISLEINFEKLDKVFMN